MEDTGMGDGKERGKGRREGEKRKRGEGAKGKESGPPVFCRGPPRSWLRHWGGIGYWSR